MGPEQVQTEIVANLMAWGPGAAVRIRSARRSGHPPDFSKSACILFAINRPNCSPVWRSSFSP